MNIAILVFLILNSLLLAITTLVAIYALCDQKQKVWKRCHKAEDELSMTRDALNRVSKNFQEYQAKFPVKSKYKLQDKVFYKADDFTYNGIITSITITKDRFVEYGIDYKGRTVTAKEEFVYLEKKWKTT